MSSSSPSIDLLQVVVDLARELPPGKLESLIVELQSHHEQAGVTGLTQFAVTPAIKAKLQLLAELSAAQPRVGERGLAFALRCAAQAAETIAAQWSLEVAWTGPATEAVPLRRVDQVMYGMVETATSEILLVTYAAYRAERALSALRQATDRGVNVKLVIELARESGGKISFDGLAAFRASVPLAHIYYWPLDRRKRDPSGSYGAMHAKCLIADRQQAFVSSANLTDNALESNMELGLVVGSKVAGRLADHFDQMILRRDLILAPTD